MAEWYEALFQFLLTGGFVIILYVVVKTLLNYFLKQEVNYLLRAQEKIFKEAVLSCPAGLNNLYLKRGEKKLGKIIGWSPDAMLLFEDAKDLKHLAGKASEFEFFVIVPDWADKMPGSWFNFRRTRCLVLAQKNIRSQPLLGNIYLDAGALKNVMGFMVAITQDVGQYDIKRWVEQKTDEEYAIHILEKTGTQIETALTLNPASKKHDNPVPASEEVKK